MTTKNTKKKTNRNSGRKRFEAVIEPWLELDLSAAAGAGELKPAYEVDDVARTVAGLLDMNRRPVLVGEGGVGKTAIVHELVRQSLAGGGARRLHRARILQISLQRRASSLKHVYYFGEAMEELIATLRQSRRRLALFIRDLDLASEYDVEAQLAGLAYAFGGPILAEASEQGMSSLFEYNQGLRQHFTTVRIEEPGFDKARVLLRMWAQARCESAGLTFTTGAIEQALMLSNRFLTRDQLPRKAIEILDQSASVAAKGDTITDEHVFDRFCSLHRTPRVLVDPKMPLHIDRLRETFVERIVGQDEAIDVVMRMISVIKAGLSDDRRPLGVFLWVGPTGVGKTYLAQLLAEHLFGHREHMVRVNMADYQSPRDADRLFGDPSADSRTHRAGILTRRLMSMPFGVALLDEFEKADCGVHDRFLQMFDEGTFINGENQVVSCRSWILVATSNAGWEAVPGATLGFVGSQTNARRGRADVGIERCFRAELLNRFDRVVHFMPLGLEDYRRIAAVEIERLGDRVGLAQRRLTLHTQSDVIDWVVRQGQNMEAGARCLRRSIERHMASALAELIVSKNPPPGTTIGLALRGDRISAEVVDAEDRPLPRRSLRDGVPTGI